MLEKFSQGFSSQKTPACVKWQKNFLGEDPFPSSFSVLFSVSLLATPDSPGADFPLARFPQNGVSGTELLRVSSHRNQHSNAQLFSRPRQLGLQPVSRPSLTPCTLGALLCFAVRALTEAGITRVFKRLKLHLTLVMYPTFGPSEFTFCYLNCFIVAILC